MATTTTTQIEPADRTFYNRNLLRRALPELAYERFGQPYPVKMYSGDQPKWRRYGALTNPLAPLSEGVTPTAQSWSKTDVTGQLQQYGTYVEISDYAAFTSNDGKRLLTELSEVLGETMGSTKDQIVRDTVAAGTSVYYANGVAGATSVVSKLSAADLNKIIRALDANNATPWKENPIVGSDKVGTKPISASYFAVIHPYTTYDLRAILTTSFINVHEYSDPSQALPGEVGSYSKIRFIESTNAKIKADSGGSATAANLKYTTANSACDLYCTIIFAKDSFGITPLTGSSMELIIKELGEGNDPLNQRRSAGFKFTTDVAILNDNFLYRYEHGCSA